MFRLFPGVLDVRSYYFGYYLVVLVRAKVQNLFKSRYFGISRLRSQRIVVVLFLLLCNRKALE